MMTALETALSEIRGKSVRLGRTRPKVARVGARQVIEDLALAKHPSEGFRYLLQLGMADLSAEALVLKYSDQFDASVVDAATRRLREHGVEIAANTAAS
jgi:hypothetical protein